MLKFKYYKVPTLDGFPSRRKESVSNLVKWRVGFQPVFFYKLVNFPNLNEKAELLPVAPKCKVER
jgi:hypothetical protein